MNEQENNSENTPTTEPNVTVESSNEAAEAVTTASDTTATSEATEVVKSEVTAASAPETAVETAPVADKPASDSRAPAVPLSTWLLNTKRWIYGRKYTIAAVVLVIVALLGLLYIMEKEGRTNLGVFDGIGGALSANKAVATVNGEKITRSELSTSVSQISAGAEAQGIDVSYPTLVAQIQTQAIDMLINTELLMQEAESRGVTVTDEDVQARLDTLKEDLGGEAVLIERMNEFGIDQKTLRRDIKNELTIKALLDEVFAEKGLEITDEEVSEFYNAAGGEEAGLPALNEELSVQIKEHIRATKEQEEVTALIEELRGKATIEVLI